MYLKKFKPFCNTRFYNHLLISLKSVLQKNKETIIGLFDVIASGLTTNNKVQEHTVP